MSYEVITAFFLEAAFLGIMLFGWNRVSPKLHFFATCMVALGTLISTFWIISANSWMQTPTGFELRDGIFYVVDWFEVGSEEHTSELQSLMRISYAVFCLKKKKT